MSVLQHCGRCGIPSGAASTCAACGKRICEDCWRGGNGVCNRKCAKRAPEIEGDED